MSDKMTKFENNLKRYKQIKIIQIYCEYYNAKDHFENPSLFIKFMIVY